MPWMSEPIPSGTRAVRNATSPWLLIDRHSKLKGTKPSSTLSATLVKRYFLGRASSSARAGEVAPTHSARPTRSERARHEEGFMSCPPERVAACGRKTRADGQVPAGRAGRAEGGARRYERGKSFTSRERIRPP